MRRLIVVAVAALCLMGTTSLALADEGARYGDQIETGTLSQEPPVFGNTREPVRADDAMKGEKQEHKEKTKAHIDTAKAARAAPAPAAKP